jgi:hypothetical protein
MPTTYSDGGTHSVSSPGGAIVVSAASTLDVSAGAAIVGAAGTIIPVSSLVPYADATPGILATGPGTTLNLGGGSATGGGRSPTYGHGPATDGCCCGNAGILLRSGASLVMTGGAATAGAGQGSAGVVLESDGCSATISGGTLAGVWGLIVEPRACTVVVSGGTFTSSGGDTYGFGLAAHIYCAGGTVAISGGTFGLGPSGTAAVSLSSGATAEISGGSFDAPSGTVSYYNPGSWVVETIAGGAGRGVIVLNLQGGSGLTFRGSGLGFVGGVLSPDNRPAYLQGVLSGTLSDGTAIAATIVRIGGNVGNYSGSGPEVVFGG